jgi:hypothetical protein
VHHFFFTARFGGKSGASAMDLSPAGTGRMIVALVIFALLAVSAWFTLDDLKYRKLTFVFLGFFCSARSTHKAAFALG